MTRKVRLGRLGLLVAVAGALAVGLPSAAYAQQSSAQKLPPGGKTCVTQYALRQVQGQGTATWNGAFFTIEYRGLVKDNSPTATALAYSRTLSGYDFSFPGPGYYTVCAYNFQSTNTNVTVVVRSDSEIGL